MISVKFGYYPVAYEVKLAKFEISPLVEIDEAILRVMSDAGVYRGWIYPPLQEVRSFGVEGTTVLPYPSRVFGLPKTHILTHRSDDQECAKFLVWTFGFFVGMRMSELDAGFLDAAAVLPGTSNDIVWCGDSLQIALMKADAFFEQHLNAPQIPLAIRAAIHSFLLADTPTLLDFERFLHLYTALEASYAAHNMIRGKPPKHVPHSRRIAYLCQSLRLPIPWWAASDSPFVADRRNETIHEGLFFGEPWGYSIFCGTDKKDGKYPMELLEVQKLTCRIIMALLDVRDETYLTSSVADRQMHGVHLN